ncbi:LysE/ArgO family amino acid transporter [Frondihabitans australicus]|uniref:L-lysine exporter family protein LysE/ArgO n=1 Tax=Frondihabitans australicus TaxID=386892 RepID=A0A495IKA0_9MICO|nr:LysE/ArgO family amino acid transporter [Frondihabitans australicus]RKR75535.1 L-lysine exporter family protein LysE/ArgO [Frondihabitans australicus]
MTSPALAALLGLATGLSLIVAIGAQNAFVLRLGIAGRAKVIAPVVAICALSDAVLISAGVAGIGALIQAAPVALIVIRVIGSGFLIVYGLMAARRAFRPGSLDPADDVTNPRGAGSDTSALRKAIVTALAFTWLNPHVYLDTVLFLGSVANHQGPDARWFFAAGAVLGSFLWFSALGFGARLLRPVFARPAAWRVLDGIIAVVMVALGVHLAVGM